MELLVRRAPEEKGRHCRFVSGGSDLFHRLGLRPLGSLGDVKLDLVAFSQGFEARGGNGQVVDEDIRTLILRDEPKPFLFVKLFDGSTSHDMILLAWGVSENGATHARRRIKKPHTAEQTVVSRAVWRVTSWPSDPRRCPLR